MIELRDVTKEYSKGNAALNGGGIFVVVNQKTVEGRKRCLGVFGHAIAMVLRL